MFYFRNFLFQFCFICLIFSFQNKVTSINIIYFCCKFIIHSFFSTNNISFTTSLSLLKSAETGANMSMSNLSTSASRLAISVCYIFQISFCCIIWKINFNINITSKISKRLGKVLSHFLSVQLLNELSYPFHLTYSLSPFRLVFFLFWIFLD